MTLPLGNGELDGVLFDLDDVLVPFQTPSAWQWAWRPRGPVLGERTTRAALRRSLHAWDRRRWSGLTGKNPPTDLGALREHLADTLRAIAGHSLPAEETEAVVRRFLHPSGEVERYADTAPALARLAERGVKVGVLTPLPLESARWLLHRSGLSPGLVLVAGDPPGPVAPDRAAFRMALERLAVEPGRAAFVGDLFWSDVRAAHRAGLASFLLDRHDAWPKVQEGRFTTLGELEAVLARPPASSPAAGAEET